MLKTLGGERWPAEHAAVLAAAGTQPGVTVIDAHLATEDKNALIRELDCYVSLHRSEGFGLTIAEAMLLETPVIATDYGGSRDFVTAFNSLPVDARMVPIGPGNDPYPADGEWAEPDLDHAAACMRSVLVDRAGALTRAQRARAEVVARHAPAVAGRAMAERLARVMQLPLDGAGESPALDLDAVRARMATGPQAAPGSERGARGAVRDAALRAMRPYTVHQRLVDEEILRVLQTLDERVQGLAAGQQALAAELARLRDEQAERDLDSDMGYDTRQARQDLLDAVGDAIDDLARALAALGVAYEQLDEHHADELEEMLFGPVQAAYGRARRTHTAFATRHGLPTRTFEAPVPGAPSTGAKGFVEEAVAAVGHADVTLATLQDSMLPIEVGDPELRAGLANVRELVDGVRRNAKALTRTIGR